MLQHQIGDEKNVIPVKRPCLLEKITFEILFFTSGTSGKNMQLFQTQGIIRYLSLS